jgi:hypothetical protein
MENRIVGAKLFHMDKYEANSHFHNFLNAPNKL